MALFVVLLPIMATAQQRVTVRELNAYENLTNENQIPNHPLVGTTVTFTGVVVSYPKSSGNATYTAASNTISRIHFFVVDTSAASMGKEGMYMQIVETGGSAPGANDYAYSLENLNVGDIVDFTGDIGNFGNTMQFDVTDYDVSANETNLIGNVNDSGFERYIPLLDPMEVTIDQLNTDNGDGTSFLNVANYSKYANAYVKVTGANISGRFEDVSGGRPYYSMTQNSTNLMSSDISLRYRNPASRSSYRTGYNFRRDTEDLFIPPVVGSVVEISGYAVISGFDGSLNRITDGREMFAIAPFEDGVLWINDQMSTAEWKDDLTVLGIAPTLTSLNQSITENIGPDSVVTVSIDVTSNEQPDASTPTIDAVKLIYTAGSTTDTLAMSVTTGNTYSVDLPKFPNFTPVNYTIEAEASNELVGRYPDFGTESFFVAEGVIENISTIQQTDSPEGLSALAGSGSYDMNINAIVVSDDNDGVIVIHDAAEMWGGIFLESTTSTRALSRGDSINITSASVAELAPSAGNAGIFLTVLQDLEFTTLSSGNDVEVAIPSLFTSDFIALESGDEIEEYEGMVVKFENVMYVELGSFGEFELANKKPLETDFPTSGAIFNDDLNGGSIGETDFAGNFNIHLRDSAMFDVAYGIVAASFGDPLVHARGTADLVGNDNYTIPQLEFDLLSPDDEADVTASSDIEISWQATTDYDGNDVTYEWVLYAAVDTTEVLALTSNSEGADASLTIPYSVIDAFLQSDGLAVGGTKDYVWNVKVSDGSDTLNVAAFYSFGDEAFVDTYNQLTLTRALQTSNEEEIGTPSVFKLEQNYPNPFNPSTTIKFALPTASNVTLTVYNMLGQKVSTLINDNKMNSGFHSISFDASNLASGMYIYRIEAASFSSIKKMLLIK
tara:strand:+ start:4513 stop:7200 length:2688 start_codon:yes stop_codon:yes gene_type:complete